MNWTLFDDFAVQGSQNHAKTPSTSGQSEPETTVVRGRDDGGGLWGAEEDAQSSQRRRKARMHEVDEATQLRRRAQNRESQQAYRQRKEVYVQGLRAQIVNLHLRHRDLCEAYSNQGRRLGMLREIVADMTLEIATLRGRQQPQIPPPPEMLAAPSGDGYPLVPNEAALASEPSTYVPAVIGPTASAGTGMQCVPMMLPDGGNIDTDQAFLKQELHWRPGISP